MACAPISIRYECPASDSDKCEKFTKRFTANGDGDDTEISDGEVEDDEVCAYAIA